MSKTLTFYVSGMTCGGCSGSIQRIVGLNLASESITLEAFNADLSQFKDPKRTTMVISETPEEIQLLEQAQTSEERVLIEEQLKRASWQKIRAYIEDLRFTCEDYDYDPDAELLPIIPIEEHSSIPHPLEYATEPRQNLEQLTEIPPIAGVTTTTEPHSKPSPQLSALILNQAKKYFSSHWFKGFLGCSAGVIVLIACLSGAAMSLAVMLPLAGLSTMLTLALGANSYADAWKKWRASRALTMDSLFALSTSLILVISLASLYAPWLPMMFDAALLIYGFRHIGLGIEDSIKARIGTAKFQDRAAKIVRKISIDTDDEAADREEQALLTQIQPGDIILVNPGEIIPLDGTCLAESTIYNTITTGAILPRHFMPDAKVLAGMRLAENAAPLRIRVSRNYQNSYLSRLDAQIIKAALDKSPIELQAVQLLEYFIPLVLLFALTAGAAIGLFFSMASAIQCVASILVSACPCTLGLIIPLAVTSGMHKAAENGVQFKSTKVLQNAEQIDTVIFDLNGTLTTGVPQVKQIKALNEQELSESQLRKICAALEKTSAHPTGKAIYAYTKDDNSDELDVTEFNRKHHSGIIGEINRTSYIIGSRSLMQKQGITLPENETLPKLDSGDDLVLVARDRTIIGYMVMTDPLREDALRTLNALKSMGKEIHLCTGAARETALRYAKELGINLNHVYAECVSNQKTIYINELRSRGRKVAMFGDAGNDAEAMAASDFSGAIASGDQVTQEAADAVIHPGALMAIASLFAISKQTVANINQNMIGSFAYNFGMVGTSGVLFITAGLTIPPAIGVVLMMSQACLILLNVYRFKNQPLNHLTEEAKETQASHTVSHTHMLRRMPSNENTEGCTSDYQSYCSRDDRTPNANCLVESGVSHDTDARVPQQAYYI
ncbi:cation-translocating P-type ATPase [Legionella lytica]|uniref:Cation-translocating P-type ATPase n=1 Tax=Legionella lytica TaxID=96232 RepID=A0ABY4Y9J3_9GAMM|nr:HAD-IC family P-type ATPase [Legionella lytica]USQ14323.1 cation-translocating P-type ATPase [Legionella lytica]